MFCRIFDSPPQTPSALAGFSLAVNPPRVTEAHRPPPGIGSAKGFPLCRLAQGAALLGCALACVQEASAQSYGPLVTGTVSNFSVTAAAGSTSGSFNLTGPSTGGFVTPFSPLSGPGIASAAAYGFLAYGDVVGYVIYEGTPSTGSGFGTFTMNFTASVIFYDYLVGTPNFAPTSWTVTGLGSISDGQTFTPGSYTFNFTTTTGSSPVNRIGSVAAFALPIPETSPASAFWGISGLLLMANVLRRRRSRMPAASPGVSEGDGTLPRIAPMAE